MKQTINKQKREINKIITLVFSLIIFFVLAGQISIAVPPLPTEFYGHVQLFNNPAATGMQVKAYDPNGELCGTFTVSEEGYYGSMTCKGRDTSGEGDGPDQDDEIIFKIGTYVASTLTGDTASTLESVYYDAGSFQYVNLVSPPLVCGDGYCDSYESCLSCSFDCGGCPDNSGGSGSGGGGSGSGGGAGSGGTVGSGGQLQDTIGIKPPSVSDEDKECQEIWICSDWSSCHDNGTRARECVDSNNCNSTNDLPDLFEYCIIEIDNETQVIPTPPQKPRKELPALVSTCTQRLDFFSFPSLIFVVLFLTILAGTYGRLGSKLNKIRKDESLSDIKKLEKEFHIKKESYIFATVISIMAIIVYFYHYFFFMCKDKYIQHLWLLGLFVILSPIIINIITEFLKYKEDVKLLKLKLLKDSHYQHFKKLLEITNHRLMDMEERIIKYIDYLEEHDNFHYILRQSPEIYSIFRDLNKLFILYKEEKETYDLEKDLLENINQLSNDPSYEEVTTKHPELQDLKTDMILLYKVYESKQELYDELYKIEQEYEASLNMTNSNNEDKNKEDNSTRSGSESKDSSDSSDSSDSFLEEESKNEKLPTSQETKPPKGEIS